MPRIESFLPTRPATGPQAPSAAAFEKLESAFLEQMMKHLGSRPREGALSGGIGEEQFHSLIDREYARILGSRIDLGLGRAVR